MEIYVKVIHIEGVTLLEMAWRIVLPALLAYQKELAEAVSLKRSLEVDAGVEEALLGRLSAGTASLYGACNTLEEALSAAQNGCHAAGLHCKELILPAMLAVRAEADALEQATPCSVWPLPSYEALLFNL